MKRQASIYVAAMLALIYAGPQSGARAQVFDFGQIEEFESLGSGTQKGGSPPKTIIDDGARHTVLFTILEFEHRGEDLLEVERRKPDNDHARAGLAGLSDRRRIQDRGHRR